MILVTGGLGYVGSHTVKTLVKNGYNVLSLDNLEYGHRSASAGAQVIIGDFGDRNLIQNVFSSNKIDAVMHFAAYAAVGESVANPFKYYENNVSRSLVLLDEMVKAGIKQMVFSSSAATYGEPNQIPIPEDHPKNPTNPYGRSKLIIEDILRDFDTAYGLKSVSLRYFNASGADPEGELGEDHDPEEHLIPIVLQVALGKRTKVSVFGEDWDTPDGTCIRDYVHVMDLAEAHVLALKSLAAGNGTTSYNLGNGNGYSVKQVIEIAREVTGRQIDAVPADRRPGDPARLVASSDKIRSELGWEPKIPDLHRIIETAWAWHSAHPDGYGD